MKTLLAVVLAASSAAFFAVAYDGGPLTGTWQIHQDIAGNESDQTCTFTQTGGDLTGTCESQLGSVKITGKVEGKKVSWMYKSEYNGSPLTMKYKGTLDSNKIVGNVNVEEYGVDGDFTAVQSAKGSGE
jgi:hypothetical protein